MPYTSFLNYCRSLAPLSEESWQALEPAIATKKYTKNEWLLKEGSICHHLFFILEGYCRTYYVIDGVEKNTGFYFENDIATNMTSFGTGRASDLYISACTPLTALLIDQTRLFQAAKSFPEVANLGRLCLKNFAVRQEAFSNMRQHYTVLERLEYLEQHYPQMLQKVSDTQLASFLGVARETLSRIRSKRAHP